MSFFSFSTFFHCLLQGEVGAAPGTSAEKTGHESNPVGSYGKKIMWACLELHSDV